MASGVSFDLQQADYAARKIQRFWRSCQDRNLFRLLLKTVRHAERCLTPVVLRQLNPREAQLLIDPSMHCKVRFRFWGSQFPPFIVFKIFQCGAGQHYISGKKVFRPSNQATPQACRIMGNRKFLDLLTTDERQNRGRSVAEAVDVVCMRDFMQYSSHLDKLPAYLGGRSNSWRTLRLHPLLGPSPSPAHTGSDRTGPAGSRLRRDILSQVLSAKEAGLPREAVRTLRSPAAPPSSVASAPVSKKSHCSRSTPSSSRASSAASSSRRFGKFHHAMSMKMRKLYLSGHSNDTLKESPESPTKDRPMEIILPTASQLVEDEELGFNTSPSSLSNNSDWEEEQEEVERLCDWSRHLGEEFEVDVEPVI